jgi:nicotinate-nucleotide adenylyltransferase
MRIGIFGGSFDPIHLGHLILAERCREQAQLDQVWFAPNALSPLKPDGATATDRQRCEMIEFAIAGHEAFYLSKVEIERGGVSYTVDTLTELAARQPDDEFFFLMGGDSLDSFGQWHQPEEILKLASPLIVNRPGADPVELSKLARFTGSDRLKSFQNLVIESPLIEISSSDLRTRIGAGHSVRYLLPRAVEKFIETQKLYASK